MEAITYQRIRRRSHGHGSARCRGFRLNSRRFSVSKLRAKFAWLLRILNTWRRGGRSSKAESPRCAAECRLRSFRRSNSFYAEAIADCLDFIKRSSVSINGSAPLQPRIQFQDPSAST